MTYSDALRTISNAHTDSLPSELRARPGEAVSEVIAYAQAIADETDDDGELTVGEDVETMTARKSALLAELRRGDDAYCDCCGEELIPRREPACIGCGSLDGRV